MTSVRSLTLTLLATVILGLGTLQFAQAQGTNQPGNNSQSQAGTQAQSQTSPRGQSAGADQGAVGNRQGAANNMSAGRQQGASNNIRSMQMQNSGGKSMARGSTTVTTQRNVTLRDGRSYAVYGHPQNRTTIIRQGQQSDRYVYLHNKRHHGSDRYVVLHETLLRLCAVGQHHHHQSLPAWRRHAVGGVARRFGSHRHAADHHDDDALSHGRKRRYPRQRTERGQHQPRRRWRLQSRQRRRHGATRRQPGRPIGQQAVLRRRRIQRVGRRWEQRALTTLQRAAMELKGRSSGLFLRSTVPARAAIGPSASVGMPFGPADVAVGSDSALSTTRGKVRLAPSNRHESGRR